MTSALVQSRGHKILVNSCINDNKKVSSRVYQIKSERAKILNSSCISDDKMSQKLCKRKKKCRKKLKSLHYKDEQ